MKTLLAITMYNQSDFTRKCLESLQKFEFSSCEPVIYDDFSSENLKSLEQNFSVRICYKSQAAGLTDSWNRAYQNFCAGHYEYFILANNDILIPQFAFDALLSVAKSHPLVVPLTNRKGAGAHRHQYIRRHYWRCFSSNTASNYQKIQNYLTNQPLTTKRLPNFNGFFFVMNRDIQKYEYAPGLLFNPANINVGNEDDLNQRLIEAGQQPVLCLNAFVFHFKDATFNWLNWRKHTLNRNQLSTFR